MRMSFSFKGCVAPILETGPYRRVIVRTLLGGGFVASARRKFGTVVPLLSGTGG